MRLRCWRSLRATPLSLPVVSCLLLFLLAVRPALAQFSGPGNVTLPTSTPEFPLTIDQSTLYPSDQEVRIQTGDTVLIHVLNQQEYNPQVLVDTNGEVTLPYLDSVRLAGLSQKEASETIAHGLEAAGIYRDPQVTLAITPGSGSIAVITGEMTSAVTIQGSRPLLQVLAQGGGLPKTASRIITIHRRGLDKPIIVDVGGDPTNIKGGNIPILPGDVIVVSRIGVVYFIGSFRTQGTIALNNYTPLSLVEAVTLSGGYSFEGKYGDLRIIRTNGGQRSVMKVNIKRVLYGKDQDPILQPNDIVFLPESLWKASITNGTLGTGLGLFSLVYSIALTR